jgi:hypothetical protein
MSTVKINPDLTDVVPTIPVAIRDDIGRVGVLINAAPITYKWVGPLAPAKTVKFFAPLGKEVTKDVAKAKMNEWTGGKNASKRNNERLPSRKATLRKRRKDRSQ